MTPEQILVELDITLRNLQDLLFDFYGERGIEAFDEIVRKVLDRVKIFDVPLEEEEACEIIEEAL